MRLVVTPEARQDLQDIKTYISQFNPNAAAGVLKAIRGRSRGLTRFPEACPIVRKGREEAVIRRAVSGSYLVFYIVFGDEVRVLRVVHGARDISTLFDADGDSNTDASE